MSRLIDSVPTPESPMEMEVLILGMPRTGIISLRTALEELHYKPFHGRMMDEHPNLYPLWIEALQAKYHKKGPLFTRHEYDKLFAGYNVSCNFPGTLVAEDLIKAYPNAKVILTNRDVNKWLHSMKQSVDSALEWKSFNWLAPWDPHVIGPWWTYHNFQNSLRKIIAPNGERQAFIDHYSRIRALVPADRLLDYNVAQGWGPLCEFLGREVPKSPFPHVNKTNQFLDGRRRRWWRTFGLMVVKVSVPVCVAGFVGWYLSV